MGVNEEWMDDSFDLDGNPRVWPSSSSGTVDMGAYENGSFHFEVVQFRPPSGGGGFEFTWISRPGDSYTVWSSDGLSVWTQREVVPSQGGLTTWTEPEPDPLSTLRFYRFGLE